MIGKRQYQILCATLMGAQTELEIFAQMCIEEVNNKGVYQEEAQRYLTTLNSSSRLHDNVHKWYNIFNRSLNLLIEQELLEKNGRHGVRIVVGQRSKCRDLTLEYMTRGRIRPKEIDDKVYVHALGE